jgi:hypothetical protein
MSGALRTPRAPFLLELSGLTAIRRASWAATRPASRRSAKGRSFSFEMAIRPHNRPHAAPDEKFRRPRARWLVVPGPNAVARKINRVGYERLRAICFGLCGDYQVAFRISITEALTRLYGSHPQKAKAVNRRLKRTL